MEQSTGSPQPPLSTREQATNLAKLIRTTWADQLVSNRRPPQPHKYAYAGSWRACDRRMVYEMTVPHEAQPFSADTLANFARGDDREREILIDLQGIGRAANPPFEVFGQQERFEIRGRRGQVIMVGKTDATIRQGKLRVKAEVKNWNPNLVARISTFSDLFTSPWTRAGAYQILSYLLGANEEIGMMVLDRPGVPIMLPVVLDDYLDEVEQFLVRAEAATDHVEQGTLPDYHKDPNECKRCPFFGYCTPPIKYEGAQVIFDDETLQQLEEWSTLETNGRAWQKLDTILKKKLYGTEMALAGPFLLTGKWSRNTTYELPDDIKAKYKVTKEKGKFTLTISKVTDTVKIDPTGEDDE